MTSIHDNPRSTRPADARLGRGLPGRWRAAGMTLVEMLVAISVLAVMILAVSSILVQTQRFISAAQENRRSHAMAFTIARIIRRDLRRVSKDGFLYISGDNKLIFSTAGPVTGISESTRGDGSIVCYGQQSTSSGTKYLWRPEYICNCTTGAPSTAIDGEWINVNFSILRQCAASSGDANSPPFTLQALANAAAAPPGNMQLPPATASDLKNLWQVLVTNIDNFQVSWTDGTDNKTGQNITWHPESKLWTHQNTTNWPRAVRITFAIKDPSMPKELRTGQYEVICIVGA